MMQNTRSGFNAIPPVVKNLIIINIIMLLATYILSMRGIDLTSILGLRYFQSPEFRPYQLVTHMFMHGGFTHLLFNMFALWMFGRVLEGVWGPKRFFIYYFVTGLGAALLHTFVNFLEFQSVASKMTPEAVEMVMTQGTEIFNQGKNFSDPIAGKLNLLLNIPTVGASGAVFGILLGFGMLFPNTQLMLLFPPIPIKAKYFVMGYGAIELYLGLTQSGSNIAHFAHLGGMLFGFFMIKYWNKNTKHFY
ncbi:MAG: rhomboid family intramembrane serine protease [Bacteroidota bacterium]|jgi:membrane associated rhomboid family serine protease|nr:rhomboid family intramembrane serine protease [Bacteroidota bacterium]